MSPKGYRKPYFEKDQDKETNEVFSNSGLRHEKENLYLVRFFFCMLLRPK